MPSSTTTATPRFQLQTARRPCAHRYPSNLGNLSSPTGLHRRPWLRRLRRALRDQRFVLHYQPIVSLADGEISHYEALVRLADEPDGRLLAPGSFLPAAERYALIGDIDRMVASQAIALLAQLRRHALSGGFAPRNDHTRVAINLSALSITDLGMLAHIEGELSMHGVDPSTLIIELTETAAISNMGRAKTFCSAVRALGCAVALDDFGAGFHSFQYLKHLPFDYLKIDGDFIQELPSSRNDQLVVKALVGLARGMGKQTIAEFVACSDTVDLLCDYGVDYAQGFQIGRPRDSVQSFAMAA
jgi:EAL domain-containing protein (putative c-di-GMP-specific phosphodiesterase class I)